MNKETATETHTRASHTRQIAEEKAERKKKHIYSSANSEFDWLHDGLVTMLFTFSMRKVYSRDSTMVCTHIVCQSNAQPFPSLSFSIHTFSFCHISSSYANETPLTVT